MPNATNVVENSLSPLYKIKKFRYNKNAQLWESYAIKNIVRFIE